MKFKVPNFKTQVPNSKGNKQCDLHSWDLELGILSLGLHI